MSRAIAEQSFEALVDQFYAVLYRFAFSLTRCESEAGDLTQEAFHIWATRGHQLKDRSKVKTWLFTTLHREFLRKKRKSIRFPHHELGDETLDLPELSPHSLDNLDQATAVQALSDLDEIFRAPVALFYLKECSYNEIAEILSVPLGTVKSRISRGIGQLQQALLSNATLIGN